MGAALHVAVEGLTTIGGLDAYTRRDGVWTIVGADAVGAPVNTVLPTIAGEAFNTVVVTAGHGTWVGAQPITYAYQWQRDGVNIGPVPSFAAGPAISTDGTPMQTETVTATHTITDAVTVTYQWLRDGIPIVADVEPPPPADEYDEELTGNQPGGIYVPAGEVWKLTGDVTTNDNVQVWGTLVMRGGDTLTITGINSDTFVGNPADLANHDIVASDIGVWVMHDGILDARGTPKTAWLRAATTVAQGATTVTLESTPDGWLVGDELILTPTLAPNVTGFDTAYDTMFIQSIAANVVTFTAPTTKAHPKVNSLWGCEVMNMTRDCRIEGTPGLGKTHISIMHNHGPQAVSDVAFRHVGPRQTIPGTTKTGPILGRYGVHFHLCGDESRGSTFDRIVVRDCDSHAIVTHTSHGVTWTDCIAHNTIEDCYWWDQRDERGTQGPETDDLTYRRCIASKVERSTMPTNEAARLMGFNLVNGFNVAAIDCVAVGVRGPGSTSGFGWPEGIDAVWIFEGCRGHNNSGNGLRAWQNSGNMHVIDTFVGYHNGFGGIDHGAYRNRYVYQDSYVYANLLRGVASHASALDATAEKPQRMTFTGITMDGGGITPYGLELTFHRPLPPREPVLIAGCTFLNNTVASVVSTNVLANPDNLPDWVLIEDSDLEAGREFLMLDDLIDGGLITWVDGATTYYIRPPEDTTPGYTYNATWNAKVKSELT